jgi:hypothetical protein
MIGGFGRCLDADPGILPHAYERRFSFRAGVLRRSGAVPRIGGRASVAIGQARIPTATSLPFDGAQDRRMPRLHQRSRYPARLRGTRCCFKPSVADD